MTNSYDLVTKIAIEVLNFNKSEYVSETLVSKEVTTSTNLRSYKKFEYEESDIINGLDNINVDKLSIIVKDIIDISVRKYFDVTNVLFQKYEHLFENLESVKVYINKNLFIPSKIKKLIVCTPYLFTSKEKLNLEELCFDSYFGNKSQEIYNYHNDDHDINFESIKRFRLSETIKFLPYIEKMINLESLAIYGIDELMNEIDITHLDKLIYFEGYTGMCELPQNITTLHYQVVAIKKIPPQIKYLRLNFYDDINDFLEFSCDNVTDLTIIATVSLKNVYCYFPNTIKSVIKSDDGEFVDRTIRNCKNLQQLQIETVSNFDFNSINESNINILSLYGDCDNYRIQSSNIKNLYIICNNTDKIELNTKELSVLQITIRYIVLSKQKSNDIVISSTQENHLNEIYIDILHNDFNISELKTEKLIIRGCKINDNNSILPSYYEHLEIFYRLLSSWITYDVKTLTINTSESYDYAIFTNCDNIYAPYLKKIIIKHHDRNKNCFDFSKHITVSDDCEIEYQYV